MYDVLSWRSVVSLALVVGVAYAATQLVEWIFGISSRHAWLSVWALGWIGMNLYFLWKREIPVGISGRSAPFYIARGWSAVLLAVLLLIFGMIVLLRMIELE